LVNLSITLVINHQLRLSSCQALARLDEPPGLILAIVLGALVLFGVGVYSSVTLVGDWRKNGLKMVAIGLGAAAVGFLIGRLFHT
jgi:VIT1/CCC1 family predicted Fe2+/Mn2+ transporter